MACPAGPSTNTGQSSDLLDDYEPRAALEGTYLFLAKTDMTLNNYRFLGLLQLAKRLRPFKLYRNSVQGVWSIPKVIVPMPKPIAIRHRRRPT